MERAAGCGPSFSLRAVIAGRRLLKERKDSFMTLRQWMVGISLAGVVGLTLPSMRALAKPPDLPVEQSVYCQDKEAIEIPCVDGICPLLFQQFRQVALDGATLNGGALGGVTRPHQSVSMDTRWEMCADRVPMWIVDVCERINRVNFLEDAVDLPAVEDAEPPLYRLPQREAPKDHEDLRHRDMLRRTKPLGLVPMVLISEHGTWSFFGQP